MTADSTLFSNNDLTEPGFGGQVVATSIAEEIFVPKEIAYERRIFHKFKAKPNEAPGPWKDQYGYLYTFSNLRDIVIVNRGLEK